MRINGNQLALAITKLEGGKVNLSNAQVHEVISKLRRYLKRKHSPAEIMAWLGW